jgi:predicted DCC family thiol-disulfide oxidoreductase YuxK
MSAKPARRVWHPHPAGGVPDHLILFDGVCVLCSRWVDFVIARDAAARFRFVAIQTETGHALAERFGVDPREPETNVAVVNERAYFKLDSVVEVLAEFPRWRWVRVAYLFPRTVRDFFYDRVALNRYRVFGRRGSCHVPAPAVRARFLDVAAAPGDACAGEP